MELLDARKNGPSTTGHRLAFDEFEIDPANRALLRDGEPIALRGKVFDVLLVFAENPARLLEKDELIERVWGDQFVEEGNLARNVSTLRHALGDTGKEHRYIVTVQGHGYRFIADVSRTERNGQEFASGRTVAKEFHDRDVPYSSESIVKRFGILIGASAMILILLVLSWYRGRESSGLGFSRPVQIAILPFKSKGDEIEYLADGVTEKVIDDLSTVSGLKVKSKNSVFRHKGTEYDAAALASTLGVEMLLIGAIESNGEQLSVDVELIDASDSSQAWGQKFVAPQTDIAALQKSIVQGVLKGAGIRVTDDERARLSGQATNDPVAYKAHLLGRYFWNKRTGSDLKKAAGYYQQAVEADPTYAAAYAGLANCYALYSVYDVEPPIQAFPKAKEAAVKALEIDPLLAGAHTSLAYVLYHFDWDWSRAESEFKRAIELNANDPTAHHWYGEFLGAAGRFDEAIAEQQIALELDPLAFIVNADIGWNYYLARNYAKAIEHYRKALELDPASPITHYMLGETFEKQGDFNGSVDEYIAAVSSHDITDADIRPLKDAWKDSGYTGFLRARVAWRQKVFARKVRPQPIEVAADHARLGDKDRAVALLADAIEKKESDIVFLKHNPAFDNLRPDPRFRNLLVRLGLE